VAFSESDFKAFDVGKKVTDTGGRVPVSSGRADGWDTVEKLKGE